jgi:hypothetical protein
VSKPKNKAGIERDSLHSDPSVQKVRNPKADHTESAGAAAAARERQQITKGKVNDKK